MSMRYRLFSVLALAATVVASFAVRIAEATRDFAAALFIATDPRAVMALLRVDTPALVLEGYGGHAVDPALAHEQRHEAGTARLGSVRHR